MDIAKTAAWIRRYCFIQFCKPEFVIRNTVQAVLYIHPYES